MLGGDLGRGSTRGNPHGMEELLLREGPLLPTKDDHSFRPQPLGPGTPLGTRLKCARGGRAVEAGLPARESNFTYRSFALPLRRKDPGASYPRVRSAGSIVSCGVVLFVRRSGSDGTEIRLASWPGARGKHSRPKNPNQAEKRAPLKFTGKHEMERARAASARRKRSTKQAKAGASQGAFW